MPQVLHWSCTMSGTRGARAQSVTETPGNRSARATRHKPSVRHKHLARVARPRAAPGAPAKKVIGNRAPTAQVHEHERQLSAGAVRQACGPRQRATGGGAQRSWHERPMQRSRDPRNGHMRHEAHAAQPENTLRASAASLLRKRARPRSRSPSAGGKESSRAACCLSARRCYRRNESLERLNIRNENRHSRPSLRSSRPRAVRWPGAEAPRVS
jgi:hypothetical protein